MAVEIKMPQLGESVFEGTISKWLKKVGDPIKEFEPLIEISTDKVDTEIPAPGMGVLKEIRVQEGQTARVGEVLGLMAEAGEAVEQPPAAEEKVEEGAPTAEEVAPRAEEKAAGEPREKPSAPPAEEKAAGERPAGRGYVTPVVARIAAEQGVDLAQVQGTGHGGRISKKDVMRYLEQVKAAPAPRPAPAPAAAVPAPALAAPAPAPAPAPAVPAARVTPVVQIPPLGPGDQEVPLSRMRQLTVHHMRLAKDTAAHVTTTFEVNMSRVSAYRKAHQAEYEAEGMRLTFTAFFMEAIVAGVKAYPMLNANLAEDKMIYRRAVNIGLAVDLGEEGLIVPVVKHADEKNLRGLAHAVNDLSERARSHTLTPDDVAGGTITLTNYGTNGSLFGTPIIPVPQIGILGVGAIEKRPVVVETEFGDAIAIRPMAYLSLSFDHRAVDGATADRFLKTVKQFLENYGV